MVFKQPRIEDKKVVNADQPMTLGIFQPFDSILFNIKYVNNEIIDDINKNQLKWTMLSQLVKRIVLINPQERSRAGDKSYEWNAKNTKF